MKKERLHGEINNKYYIRNINESNTILLETYEDDKEPVLFNTREDALEYLKEFGIKEKDLGEYGISIETSAISFFNNGGILITF